ncbi:MAG: DUF1538 domain-containing protein [Lachnospiraceae bacterium]|nr:DUF1538 domain-containing protein [Lachnospiraceae bacterium]
MRQYNHKLREKLKEAISSVLPIVAIVMGICLLFIPVSAGILLTFLGGGVLLILGMMLFTLGAEAAIAPMGSYVGSYMTRSRKVFVILVLGFFLGLIITVSEPDLQVLAELVPTIPNMTLILAVALGVALFLVMALLRMLLRVKLRFLFFVFYLAIFICAAFVPADFLAVAFDSGGVTTGPMTVPFIMAMGAGVAALRSDRHAADDSFGLVSLCSIGPVLAVMILGIIFPTGDTQTETAAMSGVEDSRELFTIFLEGIPHYLKEIAVALLPLLLFMLAFQFIVLKLNRKKLKKIAMGLLYTYVGLVLFLTGANVGFMPAGRLLGQLLAGGSVPYWLIPVGMLMGYFIVKAEPAVYVLNKQVEEMTDGNISAAAMGRALSWGVAVSIGLSMLRVLTGIPILYFVLPGYILAIAASFFVPPMYTAIAFDSGGVASGPMTAAFLVPLAQGACEAVGGNIVTDAFGVVAMVAMTPLIAIQLMGIVAERRRKRRMREMFMRLKEFEELDDDAIILL